MAELRWGAATDPGRVRKANEDGVLAAPDVFAVADGMGGHAAGEVASAVALETVRSRLDPRVATMASVTDVVRAANEAVHRRSLEDPATRGMGTTLTLIAPASGPDGDRLVLANVGDSRAYLLADGELRQLTRDHSYVEEMLAAGQITAEEARRHPHRHVVTRVLGVDPSVAVDTWLLTPERGDRYLLCSDGLINEVADEEIARLIVAASDPQAAAEALVAAANAAGGRDNITVVVIEVVDATGPSAPAGSRDRTAENPQPTMPATQQVGGWLSDDQSRQFGDGDDSGSNGGGPAGAATATALATTTTTAAPGTAPSAAPPKRKRRLVTVRTIIFTTLVIAVFVVAFVVTAAFGRSGYFVGYEGDTVAVFQGRPGGVLWFQPTLASTSQLERDDLTPEFQTRIGRNPEFSSQASAERYLDQLALDERAVVATETVELPSKTSGTSPSTTEARASTSTTAP
jgi:protein phosphatase